MSTKKHMLAQCSSYNNIYASKKTESQVDMKKAKRMTFVYYYD